MRGIMAGWKPVLDSECGKESDKLNKSPWRKGNRDEDWTIVFSIEERRYGWPRHTRNGGCLQ